MSSGEGILKHPFFKALQSISPVRGGHAAIGVKKDPETADNEQSKKNQQHQDEGKHCLLFQSQSVHHHLTAAHK